MDHLTYVNNLLRRLKRLNERKDIMESKHSGNEQSYTYHGGFNLGYLKGRITEIEDTIDDIIDLE